MSGRLRLAVVALAAGLVLCAGVAYGYFSSTGTGAAAAQAGALSAPGGLAGTPGAGTVALSWNSVTPPGSGPVSYYVTRDGASPNGTCAGSSAPSAATSCTDTGLAAGIYHYTVTAVWQSWTATSSTLSVTVTSGALDHFVVSAGTAQTAGASFNATITAVDSTGNTVSSYTGSQVVSFSGPSAAPNGKLPLYPGSVSFTSGVGTAPITLYDAQTTALTATQGSVTGTSGSLNVGDAGASSFSLPNPGTQTAGTPFSETITAVDAYGNTASGYSGAHSLSFSGPAPAPDGSSPVYPGSVSFSGGVGTASITLVDAQTTALIASAGALTGSSATFTVTGGAAASFSVANPGTQTAGTAFSETITAVDGYGNTASAYTGAQALTFSGPLAAPNGSTPVYPSSVSFSGGVGTASITLMAAQSNVVLTAVAGAVSGNSGSFSVNAGSASAFTLATPAGVVAGTAFNETITAVDGYGNTASGYTGAHSLSFSGPSAAPNGNTPVYPGSVSFSGGVGTASVTLVAAQSGVVLDAVVGGVSGNSGAFAVSAGTASKLAITSLPVSGAASPTANLGPITVQEQDAYGNPATAAITVNLSSTGTTGKFAGTQGGASITSVSIPSGGSTATFYYGNSTPGTPTLTAAATGLTSASQQATISPVVGLGIVVTGGTGTPSLSCAPPSATSTCTVSGVGQSGNASFYVTFVNSSGTQVVYSTTQASTITQTGWNTGSVVVAAGATNSSPSTLTASHSGNAVKTSTLTFGTYTLTISVQS